MSAPAACDPCMLHSSSVVSLRCKTRPIRSSLLDDNMRSGSPGLAIIPSSHLWVPAEDDPADHEQRADGQHRAQDQRYRASGASV